MQQDKTIPSLSVIIITKDEAHNIRKCLGSVQWADEIIILDSGSTDATPTICREYTDNVTSTDWPGYGPQKNRALQKARSDWVLSIDADEWVSENLQQEIKKAIAKPKADAYRLPRRTMYCGQFLQHGDSGKDSVTRLFRRDKGKFSNDIVHERTLIDGTTKKLTQPLLHNSYQTLEQLIDKMNQYSTLSAKARHESGKKASLYKAITHSLWAFIKSYIIRRGFLDGKIGLMVAISSAENSYYRYAKLLLLYAEKNTTERTT